MRACVVLESSLISISDSDRLVMMRWPSTKDPIIILESGTFFCSRQLLGKRDDGLMDLDFVQMACRSECSGFFLQRIGQRVGHTVTKKEEWDFILIIHSILVYNVCHLWLKCATYFISMAGISVLKSCCLLHPLPRFMMFLCFSISSAHVS